VLAFRFSVAMAVWHQVGFSLLNYKDDARSHKHKIDLDTF